MNIIEFFSNWFKAPTGFGTAGIRRHRICGAVTLVNLTGFTWGIPSDEDSINVSQFRVIVEPEFKVFAMSRINEARGFAIGEAKAEVDVEGEITGSTGIMAATVATAGYNPNNATNFWGAPSTGLYLNRGEVTMSRDGFEKMSASFSCNAGIP